MLKPYLLLFALIAGCATTPIAAPALLSDEQDDRPGLQTQGTRIENFKKVDPALFRGGMPTDEDFVYLEKLGIKTDISLLGGGSNQAKDVDAERALAAKHGFKFVNIALPFREPPRGMVDKFFDAVDDPANQPSYVHCRHGRDRTGTMVALYQMTHHAYSPKKALDEMTTFGYQPEKFPYYTKFVLGFVTDN